MNKLTVAEHKARHLELHRALDELIADFIANTGKLPSRSTVMELLEWSYQQTIEPDAMPANVTQADTAEEDRAANESRAASRRRRWG